MKLMNVTIKQIEGITFIGKGETNHWVTMDGPIQFNGSEAGSRPMELLLLSLGSCSGSDVVSILTKKRVSFDDLEINIAGDREETHPKVFSKIHLEYIFSGTNLPDKDLERAIELSQNKYCPIVAMLRKSCEITYSYRIKGKND
jgi:putative redox protein